MPIDVRMPDGTLVKNVPDNITQADLLAKYNAFSAQPATSVAPEIQVTPQAPQVGPEGAPIPSILQTQPEEKMSAAKAAETTLQEVGSIGRRLIADPALGLAKGAINAEEFLVGLGDILTGGRAGKSQEETMKARGIPSPQQMKDFLTSLQSPERLEAVKKVAEAKGAGPTALSLLENPSALSEVVESSLPSMALSEVGLGRYLLPKVLPKMSAVSRGATAEATTQAGSMAEQVRQENEDRLLTPAQSAISVVSGILTGVQGLLGGKMAQKLNIDDVDTLLAGGTSVAKKKSILTTAFKSALSESAFEELPQSMQEQISQNVATGKPWDQGVNEAGVTGALAGFVTAGGISGVSQFQQNRKIAKEGQPTPPTVSERIEPEVTPIRPRPEDIATPAPAEPVTEPTKIDTSHDTQAMLDELSGKDIEYVPEEEDKVAEKTTTKGELPVGSEVTWTDSDGVQIKSTILDSMSKAGITMYKVTTTGTSRDGVWVESSNLQPIGQSNVTKEEEAQLAPLDKFNAKNRKIYNMPTPELQAMADQGMIQWSDEFIESLNKPKPEILQSTPMGENTEYHILKNDQGHVANLYDKDAGQYVPDSARIFPVETFGDKTEIAAKKFVAEEQNKAAAYEPSIKEEPTGVITEEEKQFTPVGGRLINKADVDRLGRESAIALEQNLKNQEIQRDKQIKREIREDKFPAAKTPSLASALKALGGINQSNKLDMLGDTGKVFNYESAFSKDGEDLLSHIENGSLDEYLPHQLRLSNTPEDEAFDPRPGYDYLSKVIESKQKVYDYDYELAKADHENKIREKYLAKQYMEPNEAARVARIEDLDLGPMYEKIKAKPGANVARIAKMLGPQLYGSMSNITNVSVKEMFQNSFDAIKTMLEKGIIEKGNIEIKMDKSDRSIQIKDDGSGMSPDVLQNTFLTIAGTYKETDFGSGGFGIAKMLFLFGNKNVEVITMRDRKISSLKATGKDLMSALDDPSKEPDIEILTPEEYDPILLEKNFPKGHGTIVRVTVPETYTDPSTGKTEDIGFDADEYQIPALRYSPLFADIEVKLNGTILDLGSAFPKEDYTTFVNANFNWGTARIYVSTDERDRYADNVHILSNGLWQFSTELTKKPQASHADNIPHRFYIDIVSKVKPDEQGYPFTFNRQGLNQEAAKDLKLIENYLWLNYTKKDLANTSSGFGNVHYLTKKNGKVNVSKTEDLNPETKPKKIADGIQEGSNVEVVKGKLIVNGKFVPALNLEDLKNASIDADDLKIPQSKVQSSEVMLHDNLEVNDDPGSLKVAELGEVKQKILKEQDKLNAELELTLNSQSPKYQGLKNQIAKLEDKYWSVVEEQKAIEENENFKPISQAAREKFGERFDSFMYDIGDAFRALRDRIVYLNLKGDLPDYKRYEENTSYKDLQFEAIGISFDKEYRGVSIRLPFRGMFINPALPEFTDTPEKAGFGLIGTMIHELAHHQVRNHEEEFPAEMQRLTTILKSDADFDIFELEKDLVNSVRKNKDILDYLNKLGVQHESKPIGQRFKDSAYERTARGSSQDVAKLGRERQLGREIPSGLKPSYQTIGQKQQSQSVPSANQTAQTGIGGQRPPRNFRGQEVLPQWHGPEESKTDLWIYRLQNKQIDTKRVQELIGDIEENWNVYDKEQLYHGRTASGIRNFLLKDLLPVIKDIERLKISPEEVRTYLHNRHAEERNIQMNKINPDIYDPKTGRTTPNPLKDKGSGISTANAKAYLAGLDPAKKQTLEQIATKFDQMVKGTQQILIDSGNESAETIAKWNKTYKHYVPLFRVEDEMARPSGMGGTGQGFGTRGNFSKRAMGSEKDVQDILSNIIAQRERALIRAEKTRVGRALYGLAIQSPNPDFWLPINPDAIRSKKQAIAELIRMGIPDAKDVIDNLMKEPKERYLKKVNVAEGAVEPDEDFDFDSGLPVNESKEVVASKINVMARYKDFVFPVRINGKDRYIFFNKNDPRALRMVQSLKNLDVENLGWAVGIAGKFTRWFKNVNTQYNPVFGLVNFVRDFSGALLNLTNTEIKGEQAKVIAGAYKAMGGILNVHRAERKGKPLPTGPWAKLYQEARAEGFQTGYRDSLIRNQEEMQIIEHTLEQFKDSNTKKAFYAVIGGLTDFNDMMENAIRLSAYKVAIDKGLSKQKAAIIAKNLTVNFDKKGAWTAQVNALYAFFNASVQGTERIYRTITGPKGKMIIGGGILAGMVQAIMLAAAGYGDDDPPEFVREKNFIIPLPDGTYLTVPYPLGYNVLPNSGRIIMDFMLHGGRDPGKHSVAFLSSIVNSFNPLGSTSLSFQTLAPTIADPLVALGENKDAFGRPISRKDRATAPTPGYTRSRETASRISQGLAYFLNLASGGSKYQKGYISPTADELDFIAGQVGGGLYREVTKAGKAISAVVTGEEIPTYQRPILGRFAGKTGSQAAVSQTFYDNITRMTDHENEIKGRMKNRENVEAYLSDYPEARLWKRANSVENKINELNKRKRLFLERGFPKERIQAVDAQKTMLMQRFNDQVKNLRPD